MKIEIDVSVEISSQNEKDIRNHELVDYIDVDSYMSLCESN